MIDDKTKSLIERTLWVGGLRDATRKKHDKLKRVVYTLYKDDLEKQRYMISCICQKDPYIAADLVTEFKSLTKGEMKTVIYNYMERYEDEQGGDELILCMMVYNRLGNDAKASRSIRMMNERKLTEENTNDILSMVRGLSDFLHVMSLMAQEECFVQRNMEYLISGFEFGGHTLENYSKQLVELWKKCKEYGRYNCCMQLMVQCGLPFFYDSGAISMEEYHQVFSTLFTRNALNMELDMCTLAYRDDPEIFFKFRKRYEERLPLSLGRMYVSLLIEYQCREKLDDAYWAEYQKLEKYKVNSTDFKDERIFSEVAKCVHTCILLKRDPHQLLEHIKPVNACKSSSNMLVPCFEYNVSNQLKAESSEMIQTFIMNTQSAAETFYLFFNTHFKMFIDTFYFVKNTCPNYFTNEEVNKGLENLYLKGKVAYCSDTEYSFWLMYISLKKAVRYVRKQNESMFLKKEDRMLLILEADDYFLRVKKVLPLDYDHDGEDDSEQKWENCIDIIGLVAEDRICNRDRLWDITNDSDVSLNIMKKDFGLFVEKLALLSDDANLFKTVLAHIYWNRKFIYVKEDDYVKEDTTFFLPYEEICTGMIRNLIADGIDFQDLIGIYMNSFMKYALSLDVLWIAMYEKDQTILAEELFKQYLFWGNLVEGDDKQFSTDSVKSSSWYKCFNITYERSVYHLSIVNMEKKYLIFMVDPKAKNELVDKKQIEILLQQYSLLEKEGVVYSQRVIYEKIKRVPLIFYAENEEVYEQIEKSLRNAIFVRRHSTQSIAEMLKELSLQNPYCARKVPIHPMKRFYVFNYEPSLRDMACEIVKIMLRNATNLADCIFIYLNCFMKQYIDAQEYFNQTKAYDLFREPFSYETYSMGVVDRTEDGIWIYKPSDISEGDGKYIEMNSSCQSKLNYLYALYMDNFIEKVICKVEFAYRDNELKLSVVEVGMQKV